MEKKQDIEKLRQELSDANADINKTNRSLKTLAEMNNRVTRLENEYNESKNNQLKLEDYYKPSDEMEEYKNVAFLVIGVSGGYIIYKMNKISKEK